MDEYNSGVIVLLVSKAVTHKTLFIWSPLFKTEVCEYSLHSISIFSFPFVARCLCEGSSIDASCTLSWNNHIDKITGTANEILGLIKRTYKGLKDDSALRTLYLALVRSQLEFCSVVWSPYQGSTGNIMKLELIQRRATKLILKTTDEYQQRREKLNLLSLEQMRFSVWCFIPL